MFKKLFNKSSGEEILAPLTGEIVSLQTVPDPVFSEKMMGEGIAIIPSEGKLLSPVDGEVVTIPDTKHAIGLRTKNGTEILIHIGLETVALKGEGFTTLVSTGTNVVAGQELIEFDLEYMEQHAPHIITPVIITNSNEKSITLTEETAAKAGETIVMTVKDN